MELHSEEEFLEVARRALECRVKLGETRIETEEGRRKVPALKVKARTRRKLYTIKFLDIDRGVEFAKRVKEVCKEFIVLDEELRDKLGA